MYAHHVCQKYNSKAGMYFSVLEDIFIELWTLLEHYKGSRNAQCYIKMSGEKSLLLLSSANSCLQQTILSSQSSKYLLLDATPLALLPRL